MEGVCCFCLWLYVVHLSNSLDKEARWSYTKHFRCFWKATLIHTINDFETYRYKYCLNLTPDLTTYSPPPTSGKCPDGRPGRLQFCRPRPADPSVSTPACPAPRPASPSEWTTRPAPMRWSHRRTASAAHRHADCRSTSAPVRCRCDARVCIAASPPSAAGCCESCRRWCRAAAADRAPFRWRTHGRC